VGPESVEFCRDIETYLCRKNDGHLIRVTGPSFELVSGWAAQGIPIKVACEGIDRYFERYYRKGPRRRPVKIDFCEADVLDVFDEWKKALGLSRATLSGSRTEAGTEAGTKAAPEKSRGPSLPAHLERVVLTLTAARASGRLGDEFDAIIDRVSAELETARASSGGVRGEDRQALIARLGALDEELLKAAREAIGTADLSVLSREAADELSAFRDRMAPDAFARALDGAQSRLIRERFGLPTMAFL
jgi:hypothetical protein